MPRREKALKCFETMIIELCAGWGFHDDAITIDIDRRFQPTICADVRYLPLRRGLRPKILFMSPPCTFVSNADWKFPRQGIRENFDIIGACLEAVSWLEPDMWIVENPIGSRLWRVVPSEKIKIAWSAYDMKYKHSFLATNKRSMLRSHIRNMIGGMTLA